MGDNEQEELWLKVLATLDEARARWYGAQEAIEWGRGGIQKAQALTGMSRPTMIKGMRELRGPQGLSSGERVRQPGGGRKRVECRDSPLVRALEHLMEEKTAGDPLSLLRWSSKSTERLAAELAHRGHRLRADTAGRRLKQRGYSPHAKGKTNEGKPHPDRDGQFRYINQQVKAFMARGEPVISVDTRKKERVGGFKNPGRTWRPQGHPRRVLVYDYPSWGLGTALPYGTSDLQQNGGVVHGGRTYDTAEFAVEGIRRWWEQWGRPHYPRAKALLTCADGGGSKGRRNRGWKVGLHRLADRTGLPITVCPSPPGTSKWDKVEPRMSSFIRVNWRGDPLVSYETVINLISTTPTKTGLPGKAMLDTSHYGRGIKISDEEMQQLHLQPHALYPRWNYTLSPRHAAKQHGLSKR
jgi:hypothetical protein